jgi:diacylglycerol O-acyltransferase
VDELDLRAQVPVSIRSEAQRGALGNRVALILAPLPVNERDRRRRWKRVTETMRSLKGGHQVEGGELLEKLGDWTAKELLGAIVRLSGNRLAFNIVVTNVPGPQQPAYLLGSRMLAIYPVVPLFTNQGVGIAQFSYDGTLFWGFHADWDAVPDLHDLVLAVQEEFEALCKLRHREAT